MPHQNTAIPPRKRKQEFSDLDAFSDETTEESKVRRDLKRRMIPERLVVRRTLQCLSKFWSPDREDYLQVLEGDGRRH